MTNALVSTMPSATDETPPAFALPLETYALVTAGLGAGLTLSRALAYAEVDPGSWDRASRDWQAAIDESAADDLELLVSFDAAFLCAKERFEPTVEPITSDALAWSTFRRHFLFAIDPPLFLRERGLSLQRYTRLERTWARRCADDEELARTLRGTFEGPLGECPPLRIEPSPLLAAAASELPGPRSVEGVRPAARPPSDAPPRSLPSYLAAAQSVAPGPEATSNIVTPAVAPVVAPAVAPVVPPAVAPVAPTAPAPRPAGKMVHATMMAMEVPAGFKATPFASSPRKKDESVRGTMMALDVPVRLEAVPFWRGGAPAYSPPPAASSNPQPPTVSPRAALTGTAMALEIPEHLRHIPLSQTPPLPPLEDYVRMGVELASTPADRVESVLAQARWTLATWTHIDKSYRDRFARDPALHSAFQAALARERALRAAPRR